MGGQRHMRLTSFVGGDFVRSGTGQRIAIFDPWVGEPMAEVETATPGDVDLAIGAAATAFHETRWPHLPPGDRGAILAAIAAGLTARQQEFAELEALNAGKPISAALREVKGAARVFIYYAGAMDKFFGDTIPLGTALLDFTLREPLGVVGQIVPWNFPLLSASWKLAPALAAGCCCVLKPSPATPLTALLLAEVINSAGVPPGVVNVVVGGPEVGRQLVEHPRVDGISFTGSTAVGAEIMRMAAPSIKKLGLELGGKNAAVVFADADLVRAASSAVASGFGNAGQSCSARSRILVQGKAAATFTDFFVKASAGLKTGSALDPQTTLGPLISDGHRRSVAEAVDAARAAGAGLVSGGKMSSGDGFFYEPTVLDNVTAENPAFCKEIFGPVCSITPFETEADAIRLANQSEYGLNGSVWSTDIGCALRVARALRTGMVAINGLPSASKTSVFSPFGGYKRSGMGRELGLEGLAFYTEIKNVVIDLA
ncbi:MAG: aldehyde dehydrogenase family protein [Beijerinckiaceae bacterium]